MLSADDLRECAKALRRRNKDLDTDPSWDPDADLRVVEEVERDVAESRDYLATHRTQLPPDDLADRLHPLGWVMYELTYGAMQFVAPSFESLPDERRDVSLAGMSIIARVADAARGLPWPEFRLRSPRTRLCRRAGSESGTNSVRRSTCPAARRSRGHVGGPGCRTPV